MEAVNESDVAFSASTMRAPPMPHSPNATSRGWKFWPAGKRCAPGDRQAPEKMALRSAAIPAMAFAARLLSQGLR
jgi:hypothetical protein